MYLDIAIYKDNFGGWVYFQLQLRQHLEKSEIKNGIECNAERFYSSLYSNEAGFQCSL